MSSLQSPDRVGPYVRFPLSAVQQAGVWMAITLLFSLQWQLEWKSSPQPFSKLAGITLLNMALWALVCPASWWLLQRYPLRRATLVRSLLALTAFGVVVVGAHMVRYYLTAMFNNIGYEQDISWIPKYFLRNEFVNYLLIYAAMVVALQAWLTFVQVEGERLRRAHLESALAQAELATLNAQFRPHFFFNMLNTVSGLIREDPELADEAIEELSSFIRLTFERGKQPMGAFYDELDFIERYLRLQQLRFGERLAFEITVAGGADHEFPALLLHSLVENCVVHGVEQTTAKTTIHIDAVNEAGRGKLTITNSLVAASKRQGLGNGLAAVRRRLELLYGQDHTMEVTSSESSFQVSLEIPIIRVEHEVLA